MIANRPGRASIVAASLCIAAATLPVSPHGGNGVRLVLDRGPGADEVTLAWDGGQPTFEVYRSSLPGDVLDPGNKIGDTPDRTWIDLPPVGSIHYYQIESPCVVDPPERCDGIDNDCNGTIDDPGAEDYCALPHATAACVNGACEVDRCAAGFSDCDGMAATGCEVDHAAAANACSSAEYLGSVCGDARCGSPFCSDSAWRTLTTRSGRTSKWFRARATECSSCCADVLARVTLTPPTGTDYDLYVYSTCGVLWGSSINGTGQVDQVTVFRTDDCLASDDGFDYWIEVRYHSGASCAAWTLEVQGRNC